MTVLKTKSNCCLPHRYDGLSLLRTWRPKASRSDIGSGDMWTSYFMCSNSGKLKVPNFESDSVNFKVKQTITTKNCFLFMIRLHVVNSEIISLVNL